MAAEASFPHILRLVIAAFLALPALIILAIVAPFIVVLSAPSLAILVRRKRSFSQSLFASRPRRSNGNYSDDDATDGRLNPLLQHAVITGGSSGIGLSIALELAKKNCRHITLVARKKGQLADAKRLIDEAAATAKAKVSVRVVSVDVTDFSALEKAVSNLCDDTNGTKKSPGPPTLLFNCAGYAMPLAFEDLTASNFRSQVDVNYLGSVHVVKAFLPYMTRAQHIGGNIILTSSISGQTGTFGYSAYSPTKFALRGYAECMSMELAANKSNVNISLAYPPDTKTPGYEIENQSKPEECRLISESAGIWDPDVVGRKMVNEALRPNPTFDIISGLMGGWYLCSHLVLAQ